MTGRKREREMKSHQRDKRWTERGEEECEKEIKRKRADGGGGREGGRESSPYISSANNNLAVD